MPGGAGTVVTTGRGQSEAATERVGRHVPEPPKLAVDPSSLRGPLTNGGGAFIGRRERRGRAGEPWPNPPRRVKPNLIQRS